MHTDAGEAPRRLEIARRALRSEMVRRRCGVVITVLVGPLAALLALAVLGMSGLQATAVLFLLSAWLGPLLMWGGS